MNTVDFSETIAASDLKVSRYRQLIDFRKVYLVQKETQCFYLQFLGLKIIDFKNCFYSVVLPSNKDLDCIVSS